MAFISTTTIARSVMKKMLLRRSLLPSTSAAANFSTFPDINFLLRDDDDGQKNKQQMHISEEEKQKLLKFANDYRFDMGKYDVRMSMLFPPEVTKQNLKLWFQYNALNFSAEGICQGMIELPEGMCHLLNIKESKAELTNGVLQVVYPRIPYPVSDEIIVIKIDD